MSDSQMPFKTVATQTWPQLSTFSYPFILVFCQSEPSYFAIRVVNVCCTVFRAIHFGKRESRIVAGGCKLQCNFFF